MTRELSRERMATANRKTSLNFVINNFILCESHLHALAASPKLKSIPNVCVFFFLDERERHTIPTENIDHALTVHLVQDHVTNNARVAYASNRQ